MPTHTYACLRIPTHAYACLRIPTHAYACLRMPTHAYACLRMSKLVSICMSVLGSMHAHTHLFIHTCSIQSSVHIADRQVDSHVRRCILLRSISMHMCVYARVAACPLRQEHIGRLTAKSMRFLTDGIFRGRCGGWMSSSWRMSRS